MLRFVWSLGMSSRVPGEPLIAVIGATGTGKSKLAVDLATRFNGEIINGDAMQMYRGLPIITNQIPIEERQGIPHHLLGCIGFDQEPWRISHFKRECLRIIKEIRARGKLPVLVGGTHYYTQAVLFKEAILDRGGESDETGRSGDEEKLLMDGESEPIDAATRRSEDFPILNAAPEVILQKLREVDPVMASRWHPNDTRRIYRSLEIYLQTGRPASEIYQEQQKLKDAANIPQELADVENTATDISPAFAGAGHLRFPTLLFWVHTEDQELTRRLSRRVDNMAEQGLVAEAESLFNYLNEKRAQGVEIDRTRGVWVSIGFKELEPYFRALPPSTPSASHPTGAGVGNIISDSADNSTSIAVPTPEQLANLKQSCLNSIKSATRHYYRQQVRWIRGRLWNALTDAHSSRQLYVLDSTDVSANPGAWDSDVREPAERVVEAFLSGGAEACPDPRELSESVRKVFETQLRSPVATGEGEGEERARQRTVYKCSTCDVCGITVQSDEQWEVHVKGRRHKRAVKSAEKRRAKDEYFEARREKGDIHKGAVDGDRNLDEGSGGEVAQGTGNGNGEDEGICKDK
ncbi:tRNA dimethylallyltransferase [Blastomyces gilchristii SLH14081]|uniref:tRNA dimethylallyltransferase n=1 Tax=Blastomyces gilchristii (strain SLH14081) TaxID=559298 RepID=A0A179V4F0_BLAGS|nr:tRNA dimethylallyltransferase [Blastomyces gilchristii SLH14081]OAT14348.1 tRNA dimethylallyltransferase [Blastomyces gilchristii SLH14081]